MGCTSGCKPRLTRRGLSFLVSFSLRSQWSLWGTLKTLGSSISWGGLPRCVWRFGQSDRRIPEKLLLPNGVGLLVVHTFACFHQFPLYCFLPWCAHQNCSWGTRQWVAFFGTNSHPWSWFTLSSSAVSSGQNVKTSKTIEWAYNLFHEEGSSLIHPFIHSTYWSSSGWGRTRGGYDKVLDPGKWQRRRKGQYYKYLTARI